MATTDQQREAAASLLRECDLASEDLRKWVRVPVKTVRAALAPVQPDDAALPYVRIRHEGGNTLGGRLDQVLSTHLRKGWSLIVCHPYADEYPGSAQVQPDPLRAGVEALVVEIDSHAGSTYDSGAVDELLDRVRALLAETEVPRG